MGEQGRAWRLVLPTPAYVLVLGAVWSIQFLWAPKWLVSSHAGLQTLVQTLPAALIALFALAFATLFVAVQQVTSVFSSRASLILASDVRVRRIVSRTIIITSASLVLGAIIPDTGSLQSDVTAAGSTLLIASAWLVFSYGRFAYLLILDYSAPRTFVGHVVAPVRSMLAKKKIHTGRIVFRVPLLGQTLRYALSRDDIETLHASLDGLRDIQQLCVDAVKEQPSIRNHQLSDGNVRKGWLSDELRRIYAGACEQALRLQAPQEEIDLIVDNFGHAADVFVKSHQEAEGKDMMAGLTLIATTPYQVTPFATNFMTRPASALANLERSAEGQNEPDLAAYALANWTVAMCYPIVQFARTHPLFQEGIRFFGESPPWDDAMELVTDTAWNSKWANKLGDKVNQLSGILELARGYHAGTNSSDYRSQKKTAYKQWIDTTENMAVNIAGGSNVPCADFLQNLERANQAINLFGTPDVKAYNTAYFDSFHEISTELQRIANSSDAVEIKMAAIVAAFDSQSFVDARVRVLEAMEADLGDGWQEED